MRLSPPHVLARGRALRRNVNHPQSPGLQRDAGDWKVAIFAAILLIGHGVAIAAARWPVAESAGGLVHAINPLPPGRTTLRIGTFNIHAGKDAKGHLDLSRTVAALRELNLDLVGLNEVIACSLWSADNQAEALGRELTLSSIFAPCERRFGREWFGNGLLTACAVPRWQRMQLPATQERGHRGMLLSDVEWQGVTVRVLVTHIDRRRDREAQLKIVADQFLQLPPPAILMGDLNSTADDPQLRRLLSAADVINPLSAAGFDGRKRIDWILARGFRSLAAGVVNRGASDHPACWAELELRAAN